MLSLKLAQLVVGENLQENLDKVTRVVSESKPGQWVIFPEGMLSGYFPENKEWIQSLNSQNIDEALGIIEKQVKETKCNLLAGSAYFEGGAWFNAAIFIGATGERMVYRKANLATLDRGLFACGNDLSPFESGGIKFGIQICRDNAFPEQWKVLKRKGAQIVFHLNNAIEPSAIIRRHLLISRAFENQYWVASVNNAASPQALPSMLVPPRDLPIWESIPQKEVVVDLEVDLSQNSDDYLSQERRDLVDLKI